MWNKTWLLVKLGLHCATYSTFTPSFICWIYFDESFLDKNLLHLSLTKFNKIKQKTKLENKQNMEVKFLISRNIFTKPLLYIYLSFSALFLFISGGSFDLHLFPYNFLDSKSKQCVLNIVCWGAKSSVFLFDDVYFYRGYVLAEYDSKKMWSTFTNVTLA